VVVELWVVELLQHYVVLAIAELGGRNLWNVTVHESINTMEIARQLSGKTENKVLTLPAVKFEPWERSAIASMLFKPFQNNKAWEKFVRTLAKLCHKQETPQPKLVKQKKVDFVVYENNELSSSNKQKKSADGFEKSSLIQDYKTANEQLNALQRGQILEVQSQQPFPTVLLYLVCLLCIGNEELSYNRRMRHIPRKDVLRRHVETHFQLSKLGSGFQCCHPSCSGMLENMMHFKAHAFDVHRVSH
jgi:hypothetical protein